MAFSEYTDSSASQTFYDCTCHVVQLHLKSAESLLVGSVHVFGTSFIKH